ANETEPPKSHHEGHEYDDHHDSRFPHRAPPPNEKGRPRARCATDVVRRGGPHKGTPPGCHWRAQLTWRPSQRRACSDAHITVGRRASIENERGAQQRVFSSPTLSGKKELKAPRRCA